MDLCEDVSPAFKMGGFQLPHPSSSWRVTAMILQPQKASESAGATTSCAISRMFLGRRPAGKTQSEGNELFRSQQSVAGCVFWGCCADVCGMKGYFFANFLGKFFEHNATLQKRCIVLQMFLLCFLMSFFVSFEHVTFMEIIVQCILMQS